MDGLDPDGLGHRDRVARLVPALAGPAATVVTASPAAARTAVAVTVRRCTPQGFPPGSTDRPHRVGSSDPKPEKFSRRTLVTVNSWQRTPALGPPTRVGPLPISVTARPGAPRRPEVDGRHLGPMSRSAVWGRGRRLRAGLAGRRGSPLFGVVQVALVADVPLGWDESIYASQTDPAPARPRLLGAPGARHVPAGGADPGGHGVAGGAADLPRGARLARASTPRMPCGCGSARTARCRWPRSVCRPCG